MSAPTRFSFPAVPAVLLSIISVQGGAAIAKGLFPVLGAAGTTSLRIGLSALVLLAVVRPRLGQLRAAQWRAVVPYGLALGGMNFLFYCALSRIPLGLAVTLEFVGPLALAMAGSRRWADAAWVLLAAVGIVLIAPWSGAGLDWLGLGFALAAGACWAIYIVLGQRTAQVLPGTEAVAVGMLFAALPVLPFGLASGSLHLGRPVVKVFNNIHAEHLANASKPAGDPARFGLPVAGDDAAAKQQVMQLVEELGFDAVDDGTLHTSWRQQPGTPVYGTDLPADKLRQQLADLGTERTEAQHAEFLANHAELEKKMIAEYGSQRD